jgi:hypothetical protein
MKIGKSKLAKRNYLMINKNSIVVYREPEIDEMIDGQPLKFRVVELNGDRCFIEPENFGFTFKPQIVAQVSDIMEVEEK